MNQSGTGSGSRQLKRSTYTGRQHVLDLDIHRYTCLHGRQLCLTMAQVLSMTPDLLHLLQVASIPESIPSTQIQNNEGSTLIRLHVMRSPTGQSGQDIGADIGLLAGVSTT